jgi:hypothetical protein
VDGQSEYGRHYQDKTVETHVISYDFSLSPGSIDADGIFVISSSEKLLGGGKREEGKPG